jgi:VanZ family protein
MVRTGWDGHIEHAVAYAGTALLLRFGYPKYKFVLIVATLAVYAAALECLQNFSPGRHPAFEDWLASSGGALVGSTAAHLVGKFRASGQSGSQRRRGRLFGETQNR